MATKAQRHKVKLFAKIYLCVLVSWWRKCFAIKCTKITTKVLTSISAIGQKNLGCLNRFD